MISSNIIMSTPSKAPNLCRIISGSMRIIRSQSHHFQALAVLFLVPLSFSIIFFPSILKSISESTNKDPQEFLSYSFQNLSKTQVQNLLIILLYFLFTATLQFCAVSTISYSSFHAFYGEHVKFVSSIKSIFHSFFPIVSTYIVRQLILALISAPFVLLMIFVYDEQNFYFMIFLIFTYFLLSLVLTIFQLNWFLAYVVVVVESKWGFEPLKRSAHLMKGMKRVAFAMSLFYGLPLGIFYWVFYYRGSVGWNSVLHVIVGSIYLALTLLSGLVATVVLYANCRAQYDELPYSSFDGYSRLS